MDSAWGEPEIAQFLDRGLDWVIWSFYTAPEPFIVARARDPHLPTGWFRYRATYRPDAEPAAMFQMAVNDLKGIDWTSGSRPAIH